MNPTKLIDKIFLPRRKQIDKYSSRAEEIQNSVLKKLVSCAVETEWGRSHNYKEISIKGFENLDRHIHNMQNFGQTVIVCFNRYATDTDEEIELCRRHCEEMGVGFAVNTAYGEGGRGAEELAALVVKTIEEKPSAPLKFSYDDEDSVEVKAEKVARQVYGADGVTFAPAARKMLERIKELGVAHFPICVAKTQYSFSADAHAYGAPKGFTVNIRDIVINCGAEMIVLIAGDIMRMPGLPKSPQAERIDLVNGQIEGLS